MSRLTISMPKQMSDWVEAQVDSGRYGNVSEYFHDLVRHDQDRKQSAIRELRDIFDRAEASGINQRTLPEIVKTARQEARRRGLLRERD